MRMAWALVAITLAVSVAACRAPDVEVTVMCDAAGRAYAVKHTSYRSHTVDPLQGVECPVKAGAR